MKYQGENLEKRIKILSEKIFMNKYGEIYSEVFLGSINNHINFCKIEYTNESYLGTIVIPKQKYEVSKRAVFGFYITKEWITFLNLIFQSGIIFENFRYLRLMMPQHLCSTAR